MKNNRKQFVDVTTWAVVWLAHTDVQAVIPTDMPNYDCIVQTTGGVRYCVETPMAEVIAWVRSWLPKRDDAPRLEPGSPGRFNKRHTFKLTDGAFKLVDGIGSLSPGDEFALVDHYRTHIETGEWVYTAEGEPQPMGDGVSHRVQTTMRPITDAEYMALADARLEAVR